MRGVRTHNQRTRSSLHPSERQSSIFTSAAEILRQASFQIYQFDVCQQFVGSTADAGAQLSEGQTLMIIDATWGASIEWKSNFHREHYLINAQQQK